MNQRFIFIVFILIICIISNPVKEHLESTTDPAIKNAILHTLRNMHQVFNEHKIFYCIEGGTLLGAVRNQQFIPWDDDADVMVWRKDVDKILALKLTFNKLGHDLGSGADGRVLRIFCKKGEQFPFIDLFIHQKEEDGLIYRCLPGKQADYVATISCPNSCCQLPKKQWHWWAKYQHTHKTLLPRKLYKFSGLELWGPNNPMPYIKGWYGVNAVQNPLRTHTHQ